MINLLLFLFFIGCAGLAAAWLVENPGDVSMQWFGYQIDTSVAFIFLLILLASLTITLFAMTIRRMVSAPGQFMQRRSLRQLKSGISELTYSVAALAASDIESAETHTRKVEKLLGRTPLTLLLSAQIAKTRGDEKETQAKLEQLLEYRETEYLAARFLSDSANKYQNLPKALNLAKQAQNMNPKDKASALAVVSLEVRLKHWHDALANLERARLPRKEKQRLRALIQVEYAALLLEEGHDEEALHIARGALGILPGFAPAAAVAARAYSENHKQGKALSILKKAWKKAPSPLLAETLHDITAHEEPERKEKLHALFSTEAPEGIWLCKSCEHKQKNWSLHCAACNSFDTMEWKTT
jgi:HemY protein